MDALAWGMGVFGYGWVVEVDPAFCRGPITKEPGRAQVDRLHKRKSQNMIGEGLPDFACLLPCWHAGEKWVFECGLVFDVGPAF